jgi:hypothetical protein
VSVVKKEKLYLVETCNGAPAFHTDFLEVVTANISSMVSPRILKLQADGSRKIVFV